MACFSGILGFVFSPVVSAAKSVSVSILTAIASGIAAAVAWMVKGIATFWVSVPTPELASSPGSSTPSASVGFLQAHLWWYMAAAAIAGVLVGGARMAWEQRGDAGKDVVRSLFVFVATVAGGLGVISLLTSAADQFSAWIIASSTSGSDFGANLTAMFGLTTLAGGGLNGAILVIFFGIVIFIVSLIQLVLMIVRGGMLVILAGLLPTSAAFTSTQLGRQWFRRSVSWLAAFILYKPAAAIIYATAFELTGRKAFGSGGPVDVVTGLMLMVLAVLALPALMKFVTPLVGATAAGGGATVLSGVGGAIGAGALMGGLPSGARRGVGPSAPSGPVSGTSAPSGSATAASASGLASPEAPAAPALQNTGREARSAGTDATSRAVAGPAGLAAAALGAATRVTGSARRDPAPSPSSSSAAGAGAGAVGVGETRPEASTSGRDLSRARGGGGPAGSGPAAGSQLSGQDGLASGALGSLGHAAGAAVDPAGAQDPSTEEAG